MNTELIGSIAQIVLMVVLAYPLGMYIAKVYKGEKTWLDFMAPVEKWIYKLCGINPNEEMNWKSFLKALLTINVFWFFWGMVLLCTQKYLPLNPDGNASQSPDLAFNTCISFMVNCNLQHYSGESGLTYFTQLFVIMLFQFITAATGMAALAGVFKAMAAKTTNTIGNFWNYLVKSCTRILLPMSLIVGFILILQGVPMGFDGKMAVTTMEGTEQLVSQGPTAAIVPIKQLGTNGGGYFGVNSSHPLENPTYLSNMVECWAILILPMAMVFALGFYLKRKKLGYTIFGVMLFAYLASVAINTYYEMNGNPRITEMGIDQTCGAMEGKETRLGPAATALWSCTTTVTSNGSVNGMHDSTMPLSGMMEMLNMQINTWFGGVGVGFMNYYAFLIIAVFISGLMVGRTPEFLGKKVEAREMKIATIVALAHPFVILIFTAISSYIYVNHPAFVESEGGWLNNPGFHGLSEMLYEYTSASANNGSGFEGLGDNTWFWNFTTGLALIISRYLPIVGQVAIAGLLAQKKFIPESAGTLKTDTVTFGVMTFCVIFIVAALSFFPALTLGPIAEYFSIY
ncbi:potassium-transporting ATPase A chain [Parabacteroides sp. HGS0025]|jgi:K+-transporting ATPase ATPase A chain|uniref:potassium-transporting ATPase subunit KdpA n=1 Tax=Parabacteroides sp. HGS0025 TaxID=1078087 RepID=UPI000616F914|nr:potassium-transporting ATPase subunit KdpA [Parabacteroides sp. HGS0025]KKB48993.1 potassium-transporting ATPase A chain [Parabacteroides sp. HGS0025]